jgi:hypothetical protein
MMSLKILKIIWFRIDHMEVFVKLNISENKFIHLTEVGAWNIKYHYLI